MPKIKASKTLRLPTEFAVLLSEIGFYLESITAKSQSYFTSAKYLLGKLSQADYHTAIMADELLRPYQISYKLLPVVVIPRNMLEVADRLSMKLSRIDSNYHYALSENYAFFIFEKGEKRGFEVEVVGNAKKEEEEGRGSD